MLQCHYIACVYTLLDHFSVVDKLRWKRHPYAIAAIWIITIYFAWNSLSLQTGKLNQAIFNLMNDAFGIGRFFIIILVLWLLTCLLINPATAKRPLLGIAYYIVNSSLLTGVIENAPLGTTAGKIADTILIYTGFSGLLFIAVFLDIVPFIGLIEKNVKKVLIPDIQQYIKRLKPIKPMKSAAPKGPDRWLEQTSNNTYKFRSKETVMREQLEPKPRRIGFIVSQADTLTGRPAGHVPDTYSDIVSDTRIDGVVISRPRVRGGGKHNSDKIDKVFGLRREGFSIRDIEKQTGIPRSTIFDILNNANKGIGKWK